MNSQVIAYDNVEESSISTWIPKLMWEYEGVYIFGMSESESEMIIIGSPVGYVGQIKYYQWSEELKGFIPIFKNLTNLTVLKDGKFRSDSLSGEFVRYLDNDEYKKGLKIYNPWTSGISKGKYEIGLKHTASNYFAGRYAYTSTRVLDQTELQNMTKRELQIMRNEILARYGYEFNSKGEMDSYFRELNWYFPIYKNVDRFLTQIEILNISLIKKEETKR